MGSNTHYLVAQLYAMIADMSRDRAAGRTGSEAMEARAQRHLAAPGGASTIDDMSDSSFPASDPPAVWIWEVRERKIARPRSTRSRGSA